MNKLLVIIPYRDRENHLKELIPFLRNLLDQQKIIYEIVIIEQSAGKLFNRGMLCNIGFNMFYQNNDYVCFHDVDMLCDNIDYAYDDKPVSLVSYRTKNQNTYSTYLGGITLFPNNLFIQINGFSNKYWGWGAEDDDLYRRCVLQNIQTGKRNGSCTDLELTHDNTNRRNNPHYRKNLEYLHLTKTLDIINSDGLNQIPSLYKIVNIHKHEQYTMVQVDI